MATPEALEQRIIDLELLLTRQERMSDELSAEILRLNRLVERLTLRFEEHETRQAEAAEIRTLAEEAPPPHY